MEKNTKPPEKEEVKKKWTFHLKCTKCPFKFSIERNSADMNKVNIRKMKCLECGASIMWDPDSFYGVGSSVSQKAQSKMNVEASQEAIRMASKMRQIDSETGTGKMIAVTNTQEGKNKGRVEMIPEKVLKSIDEKIGPILD